MVSDGVLERLKTRNWHKKVAALCEDKESSLAFDSKRTQLKRALVRLCSNGRLSALIPEALLLRTALNLTACADSRIIEV